jgi:hypothetical protein
VPEGKRASVGQPFVPHAIAEIDFYFFFFFLAFFFFAMVSSFSPIVGKSAFGLRADNSV